MSASDKISFMNKFIKFISRDGLELWWKTADQSKQVQGVKSLLLSSFCLLEWGEGNSPALPESRQTFEVAAAQTSRRVNRVFSRQTVFFFVCELLLIDKPMVTSEPAVTSAQLLGLGSKLYHSNMQHMLNEDNTRFIQSPSRVRQNRGSERKAVLAGTMRAPQFTLQTSQQTRDRKRIKKKKKNSLSILLVHSLIIPMF